ncbi:hypothetical protein MLD38_012283 [Melastoma candidum]|uniref:Uncharacterized protein n=1 Tax=Melastoma candidum TaxID=119954 RepID=A0ACB9R8U9_9MYRT|nr:hypothetical protein MLD38_012283 [Melastoma candidum]
MQLTTPGYDGGMEKSNLGEVRINEKKIEKREPSVEFGKYSGEFSVTSAITYARDTPEVEWQPKYHLASIEEEQSTVTSQSSQVGIQVEKSAGAQSPSESSSIDEVADTLSSKIKVKKIDVLQTIEKNVEVDGESLPAKGKNEVPFDEDEVPVMVSLSTLPPTLEAPGALKTLHGKGDDVGAAAGGLSRLAGLGRAARRQLATTLDEFWGQLFDFHGLVTQEAKLKKLDVLLGIESNNVSSSQKMETNRLDSAACYSNRAFDKISPSENYTKSAASLNANEAGSCFLSVPTVPRCGDDCIWKAESIISFGVWCIHKILDLSLMESRPELWGKYTYVLKPSSILQSRSLTAPCFCVTISGANDHPTFTPVLGNGNSFPLPAEPIRGKCTTATVLDTIKDVEVAISGRKGRTGTAAGDIAFPKGKENLASVLKRYKRRLSRLPCSHKGSSNPRKAQHTGSYGS